MYYFECQCVRLIHEQYVRLIRQRANVQGGAPKAAEPSVVDERREATLVTIIKELLPEAVRGFNAGEASESAVSPACCRNQRG